MSPSARVRRHAKILRTEALLLRKFSFIVRELDDNERYTFARAIRRAAAANEFLRKLRRGILIGVSAILFGATAIALGLVIPEMPLGHRPFTTRNFSLAALLSFLAMFAVFTAIFVFDVRFGKLLPAKPLRLWTALSVLLGTVGAMNRLFLLSADRRVTAVLDGLMAAALVVVVFVVAIVLGGYILVVAERLWGSGSPESRIIYMTAMTMYAIRGSKWRRLDCRARALARLERVAYALEVYVPAALTPMNASIRSWVKSRYQQMAALPRELQKWVAAPRADTYNHLFQRLMFLLKSTLRQDWEAISFEILETPERPQRALRRFAQTFTIALLPSVGTFILVRAGLLGDASVSTWLVAGSYVWAIAVTLLALDPLLASRISAIRDLKNIIDGRKM